MQAVGSRTCAFAERRDVSAQGMAWRLVPREGEGEGEGGYINLGSADKKESVGFNNQQAKDDAVWAVKADEMRWCFRLPLDHIDSHFTFRPPPRAQCD